jgi:hypothetical protein
MSSSAALVLFAIGLVPFLGAYRTFTQLSIHTLVTSRRTGLLWLQGESQLLDKAYRRLGPLRKLISPRHRPFIRILTKLAQSDDHHWLAPEQKISISQRLRLEGALQKRSQTPIHHGRQQFQRATHR